MDPTAEHARQVSTTLPRHQHELDDGAFLAEFDPTLPELAAVTGALADGDLQRAKLALVEHFRDRRAPRWIFDLRAAENPSDAFFLLWPARVETDRMALLRRADLTCANCLTVAEGVVLDFGPELDWVTPETRSLIVPGNCFKCCHWLRDVAFAWSLTRDPRYAGKWSELVRRWLQDFPMMLDDSFTGEQMIFNQHFGEKSMPTGQRLFCWLSCLYTGIPFAPEVDSETAFQFIKAIWYNGGVYQYFENSPFLAHNHHIMRTVNVPACMALAFPETPRFAGMTALAHDRMKRHVHESFLPDGSYVERSSSYAQVTVCMFLAPLALARLNGIDLADADTVARVRCAAEFYASTVLPTGHMPPCGDGRSTDPQAVAGALALAARACDSEIAAAVLHRTGLVNLLSAVLRPDPSPVDLPRHCHRPGWGIAVLRTGWDTNASALSMNIPDGTNKHRSHAHDDALSCSLVVRGRSIIAVPADELYIHVNAKPWADTRHHTYLYSSLGKNVVLPSGQPRLDPFKQRVGWMTDTPAVESYLTETASGAELTARAKVLNVDWKRQVTLDGETWTVRDHLARAAAAEPDEPHVLQWHFGYGVEVVQTPDGAVAEDGHVKVRLTFEADTLWEADLERNIDWLKPNGARTGQPAPWLLRVHFGAGATDAVVTTCFMPQS